MALLTPYRAFFALPDVKATLAVTFFARLPVGMMGLAMVMYMRESMGNFKLAGTVLGVYFFAMAIAAPIQGRIIDRVGPMWPLRITGLVEPIAFAVFIGAVWWKWPLASLYAIVIVMGAFSPPITVLTRALWRHRFDSDDARRMAFSVDSVIMEINFTVGPAIIGLLLAYTNPRIAIMVAWICLTTSILVFFQSPALKYWKQEDNAERHMLGPLTEPRLLLLFVTVLGLTLACGLLEVGYPAYATAMAMPAFAGVLLALNSLGSALGGAVFGAMRFHAPLERQFAMLLAIFGLLMFLHLTVDSLYVFAAAAFIAGWAISPAFASQALMISRLSPAKYTTEAFTWASTFIVSGLGAGMALSGWLSESIHVKAPFAVGGILLLCMAALALFLRTGKPQHA